MQKTTQPIHHRTTPATKIHRYIFLFFVIISIIFSPRVALAPVSAAEDCKDLELIFIRGSGGGRWDSADFLEFQSQMTSRLAATNLSYTFHDLDYPAIAVGINHLGVTLRAFFSGGEAYEFGASVDIGIRNLISHINNTSSVCANTKYVIAGYSQGASVVHRTLKDINPDKIIYVATFGDPKIYLPEGQGLIPAACRKKNLSRYRQYVPDCYAYQGIFGGQNPFETPGFENKIGTWCNTYDVLCSSFLSVSSHTSYTTDGIYDRAADTIFRKITDHFNIVLPATSEHDTIIIFDDLTTAIGEIDSFKLAAARLVDRVFKSGGRASIYIYHTDDTGDTGRRWLKNLCDFTCDRIDTIRAISSVRGAGSTFSASGSRNSILQPVHDIISTTEWLSNSKHSIAFFTARNYTGNPIYDTVSTETVADLLAAQKATLYISASTSNVRTYVDLCRATNSYAWTIFDYQNFIDYILGVPGAKTSYPDYHVLGESTPKKSLQKSTPLLQKFATPLEKSTTYTPIFDRFADRSLTPGLTIIEDPYDQPISPIDEMLGYPYAAEAYMLNPEYAEDKPALEITNVAEIDNSTVKITFTTTGINTLVSLNNTILGTTDGQEIVLSDLDRNQENTISLSPLSEYRRGDPELVTIPAQDPKPTQNPDNPASTDSPTDPNLSENTDSPTAPSHSENTNITIDPISPDTLESPITQTIPKAPDTGRPTKNH